MDSKIRSYFLSPPRFEETVRPGTAGTRGAVFGVSSGTAPLQPPKNVERALASTTPATANYFVVTASVHVETVRGGVACGQFHLSMTHTVKQRRAAAMGRDPSGWVMIASALLFFSLNVPAQTSSWVLVPQSKVPETATFWVLSWTDKPPLPCNPYPGCDVYSIGDGQFIVDDSVVAMANALLQEESMTMAEQGEPPLPEEGSDTNNWPGEFEFSSLVIGSNDLWLQVTGVTNANVFITANNTHPDSYYQLLSRTNMSQLDWFIEQEFLGASSSTQTVLNPVPMQDRSNTFFWAAHSDQLISILAGDPSYETAPGSPGWFVIASSEIPASDFAVRYRISGTASNGMDYEPLAGVATIPAGVGSTNIFIRPIADNFTEGTETVTLTLIAGTNYLLMPGYTTATLPIYDSTITLSIAGLGPDAIEPDGPPGAPARPASFEVTRTDDFSLFPPQTIHYVISGTASNGVDYTLLSGKIDFSQGLQSTNIQIQPIGDNIVEGVETVTITLIPTNSYMVDSVSNTATLRIKDSSTTVTIVALNPGIEPNGPPGQPGVSCVFELDRVDERSLAPALPVQYTLAGTALNGSDYVTLSGTATFLADNDSVSLVADPQQDTLVEGVETVLVTLINNDDSYLLEESVVATNSIVDSSTVLSITATRDAVEINQAGSLASQDGIFTISRTDSRLFLPQFPAMTAYYRVTGGTAIGGVDYATTNLTGKVDFLAGQPTATILVRGLEDNIIEPPETVIVSLIATNGYLVDTNRSTATLSIQDNVATNVFVLVTTDLVRPIGIDYHAPSNSLIVSRNYGVPNALDFARVYDQGGTTVTDWSTVLGLRDEIKLATVKVTTNGFIKGQTYFGTGTNTIGRISADGGAVSMNWAVLAGETQDLRGSLYVDQTGVWGNDLIAVMSNEVTNNFPKHIWRVHADGTHQLVTTLNTLHLEGCITVPNDPVKWGPWAGRILTGDENTHFIYDVGTDGSWGRVALGMNPEDFDFIRPEENLYMCDPDRNAILKLTASFDSFYTGALLITQAGELNDGAALFVVYLDPASQKFIVRSIPYLPPSGIGGHFEHLTFAPINLPIQP